MNPLTGVFTDYSDKEKIAPVLVQMCLSIIQNSDDEEKKQIARVIIQDPALTFTLSTYFPQPELLNRFLESQVHINNQLFFELRLFITQ